MTRKIRPVVDDILETIERIRGKVGDTSFAEFAANWELQFIAQRGIEIISEATRHLPDEMKATRPEIPWRSIAGIGSVLRHEYHKASDKIIWDVIQTDLPALEVAIREFARQVGE